MRLNPISAPFQKLKPFRSKELREASRGRPCIRCGNNDGSTVYAHYTGLRQQAFGKGTATKCHDIHGADLCMRCHNYFDQYQGCNGSQESKVSLSEEFLYCVSKTQERNINEGVLVVSKGRQKCQG
ncbi:hypothetical protein [Piscirickettsia litoralis]|uniref:Uncharacterized protein n=1 Tax=Piscirickettsia litoralis TaxID=1891921 RepID=A0ABX3A188_9GAMM|nr:hypothetical protein [Piscirickettsia litoralis]ODN41215.1 hypothetical protein BGC07_17530 [Piscirickettsia litoralis]